MESAPIDTQNSDDVDAKFLVVKLGGEVFDLFKASPAGTYLATF